MWNSDQKVSSRSGLLGFRGLTNQLPGLHSCFILLEDVLQGRFLQSSKCSSGSPKLLQWKSGKALTVRKSSRIQEMDGAEVKFWWNICWNDVSPPWTFSEQRPGDSLNLYRRFCLAVFYSVLLDSTLLEGGSRTDVFIKSDGSCS